jgi:hypothetical protein
MIPWPINARGFFFNKLCSNFKRGMRRFDGSFSALGMMEEINAYP